MRRGGPQRGGALGAVAFLLLACGGSSGSTSAGDGASSGGTTSAEASGTTVASDASGATSADSAATAGDATAATDAEDSTTGDDTGSPTTFGGDRPVELFVPDGYDPGVPAPLLLLLHGYNGSGSMLSDYFGLRSATNARGILYAHPDGTIDQDGKAFWNGTDACCDRYDTGVDDSGYLRGLIEEIQAAYNVDPRRIFLMGHSNGSFMAYRMACDHADLIAGIAGMGGATYENPDDCEPTEPVHVLHVHGTADETVAYDGGWIWAVPFPGAVETSTYWADVAGCDPPVMDLPPLDVDVAIAGDETALTRWEAGCDPGGSVDLWTIEGGAHIPTIGVDFTPQVLDHLLAHPKP